MVPDMLEPVPGDSAFGKLAPMITSKLPVFKGAPKATSVTQQLLTNCPLAALLAAIAHADPNRLFRMIHYVGVSRPRSVWFFGKDPLKSGETMQSSFFLTVYFQHRAIEITPWLYAKETAKPKPGESREPTTPRFAFADDGSGWVSYIEKAYVIYRGNYSYNQLDFLGGVSNPLAVSRIVEDVAMDFDKLEIDRRLLFRDLEPVSPLGPQPDEDRFVSGDVVGLRGRDARGRDRRRQMVKAYLEQAERRPTIATDFNHTKAVLKLAKETVTLFDPLPNHVPRTPTMSLDEFIQSHDAIYQLRG